MTTSEITAYRCISATEAAELLRSPAATTLFDVREMSIYKQGHIDGAAHLSEDRLLAWMRRLPKDAPVVIYCHHGNASKTYAQMFIDFRYTQVFSVDGGYQPLVAALAATADA